MRMWQKNPVAARGWCDALDAALPPCFNSGMARNFSEVTRMVRWVLAAAVFLGAGASIAPAIAGALALAPHRAVYDLSLADSAGGGSVASVSGRMVMEFT